MRSAAPQIEQYPAPVAALCKVCIIKVPTSLMFVFWLLFAAHETEQSQVIMNYRLCVYAETNALLPDLPSWN